MRGLRRSRKLPMRDRYRIYACPEPGCPKIAFKPGLNCPTHSVSMIETIVQPLISKKPTPEETAKKLRDAADKVGEAAGKPNPDPFGIGDMLMGIGKDMKAGRRHFTDEELDADDNDDDD